MVNRVLRDKLAERIVEENDKTIILLYKAAQTLDPKEIVDEKYHKYSDETLDAAILKAGKIVTTDNNESERFSPALSGHNDISYSNVYRADEINVNASISING